MTPTPLETSLHPRLDSLRAANRLRALPDENHAPVIDLCSNDYLALGARATEWREEFDRRFGDAQFTSSASRLLSRRQRHHLMLEDALTKAYGRPALVFNSGYHANMGCIGALNLPGTLFVADKLIHASAIDALHACGASYERFRHNDTDHLQRIICAKGTEAAHIVVLVESVYSMDGDLAPLRELAALRRRDPRIVLYVDEAHAVGCFGERGLGLCEQMGLTGQTDIIIGTAGKALASSGAYAVTGHTLHQWLLNSARAFIFSTALPPACCAWTQLMLEKSLLMADARTHLQRLAQGFANGAGLAPSGSQILPFLTGNAARALALAGRIHSLGYDVLPIRRPTVPPGGERLRLSLNAALTQEQLEPLAHFLSNEQNTTHCDEI